MFVFISTFNQSKHYSFIHSFMPWFRGLRLFWFSHSARQHLRTVSQCYCKLCESDFWSMVSRNKNNRHTQPKSSEYLQQWVSIRRCKRQGCRCVYESLQGVNQRRPTTLSAPPFFFFSFFFVLWRYVWIADLGIRQGIITASVSSHTLPSTNPRRQSGRRPESPPHRKHLFFSFFFFVLLVDFQTLQTSHSILFKVFSC